jgi:hypothetical protein
MLLIAEATVMAFEIIFAIVIFIGLLLFVIGGKSKKKWVPPYNSFDDPNDLLHPSNPLGPNWCGKYNLFRDKPHIEEIKRFGIEE